MSLTHYQFPARPIGAVMREALPFLLWSIIVLGLAIVYPPIVTWLPSQIR